MKLLLVLELLLSAVLLISCEENRSDELPRGTDLQHANGTYLGDEGQGTEKWTAESANGTYTNRTGKRMTDDYRATYVNHTSNWKSGVPKGITEKLAATGRVGDARGKHNGTYRNQRWNMNRWSCNGTCPNRTTNWRIPNCNRTCVNQTCGWRGGCTNNTWYWGPGDCYSFFRIFMYPTWNWRPGYWRMAYLKHVGSGKARISDGKQEGTHTNSTTLRY